MKVLLLFDLSIALEPEQYEAYMKTEDWQSEANIQAALKKLGHEVKPLGIHDDLQLLIYELRLNRPDLIFNLSEAFRGNRKFEPHIASLFELMEIPFTGTGANALGICKNKGLAKKILTFHGIAVPDFLVSRKAAPLRSIGKLKFPVFIKPLNLEASEGISQLSFATNAEDALERVKYLHGKYETDVIVEEYIEGREIYVGVIGNERLMTLPPRELLFTEVPDGEPKFASFRAKWDDNYRKKWGIKTDYAKLDESLANRIEDVCKNAYRALGLRGYARIDLRIRPDGEIVCLEANPNPSVEKDSDFALSAVKSGMSYEELVGKIVSLGLGADTSPNL